jgi:hypothetical protein
MKQFLFLYPIERYFDNELEKVPEFMDNNFRKKYFRALNRCIKERYRQNKFGVNWALFKGHSVCHEINVESSDRLIYTDITFKTHLTEKPDGNYTYPDNNFMLNQLDLGSTEHLRIAGFHIFDCVEKLAERANDRGLNVLVDEDLTEFFAGLLRFGPEFRTDCFPSYNPKEIFNKEGRMSFDTWFKVRKGKPWFWQDYSQ